MAELNVASNASLAIAPVGKGTFGLPDVALLDDLWVGFSRGLQWLGFGGQQEAG